jgi:hypothetical protein
MAGQDLTAGQAELVQPLLLQDHLLPVQVVAVALVTLVDLEQVVELVVVVQVVIMTEQFLLLELQIQAVEVVAEAVQVAEVRLVALE